MHIIMLCLSSWMQVDANKLWICERPTNPFPSALWLCPTHWGMLLSITIVIDHIMITVTISWSCNFLIFSRIAVSPTHQASQAASAWNFPAVQNSPAGAAGISVLFHSFVFGILSIFIHKLHHQGSCKSLAATYPIEMQQIYISRN